MTVPAKHNPQPAPATIEDVITRGDLSKLTSDQRSEFYIKLCNRHGLDPLTQPFDWLILNGKLTLYANRRCTDQLRKINQISIALISRDYKDGCLEIHVKAKDKDNREDEDLGVVALPDTLKGDARANTILKAVTKAKRRVTLSISGLGYLDETEVEDIPATKAERIIPPSKAADALIEIGKGVVVDPETGELPPTEEMTAQGWRRFGEQMVKIARDGGGFTPEQQAKMSLMLKERPAMHAKMSEAIRDAQAASRPAEEAERQPNPGDDPDAYRTWLIDQMSRIDQKKNLNDFFNIQRPLWEPCFPPDIEDWESLFKERASELQ